MEPIFSRLQSWRRSRRRRRNLRLVEAEASALPRHAALACAATVVLGAAGAAVLWRHAGNLAAQADTGVAPAVAALQAVAPGLQFAVPDAPDVAVQAVAGGRLLVASGLHAGPAVPVDLCSKPLPLHAGYRFSEVAGQPALRHALLVGADSDVPAVTVLAEGTALRVRWRERGAAAQWVGDMPGAAMRSLGWLTWPGGALRLERRASTGCAQGEMRVTLMGARGAADAPGLPGGRLGGRAAALAEVVAFPAAGPAVALRLPAGRYAVPAQAAAPREDEALFQRVLARGLLRMGDNGLLELAPPDLAQWLAAPGPMRAAELDAWRGLAPDREMRGLLKRLYRQADGAYVRRQVDLFNSERRLLAWRLGTNVPAGTSVTLEAPGGAAMEQAAEMPPVAVRLFADLPQGWQAWQRAAHWTGQGSATLVVQLPRPASGKDRIGLLLAGAIAGGSGTRGAGLTARNACDGAACRAPSDVQAIILRPEPGARRIALPVGPIDVSSALHPGDQAYRHIRLAADGSLRWYAIASTAPRRAIAARVGSGGGALVTDRDGVLLWSDGAPTPAARKAALTPLLGVDPAHVSSLSGMLARAAQVAGRMAPARLSISLPLQTLGQAILECQGLRGGKWGQDRCEGAGPAPTQRRAGLLVMDADHGDILLAAGVGGPQVTPDNWREARDFDRANPARSALRLPAWQHDGGAHSSPGSAFKVVSALGLEMAARHDPVLDAMLGGLPLPALDQLARQRGFAFRSDAAAYPYDTQAAHITNYREQSLLRRAESGRLGLAQAMTYSVNTWFAWAAELSDRTLQGLPAGGAAGLRALEPGALEAQRPLAAAARALGFGTAMRLDGGLLPDGFPWQRYDALQSSAARFDPIDSRHELRQMAIGLRMQATPLQMAVAAAAIASGKAPVARLLLALGARESQPARDDALPVRLDRIRKGMKGVVDAGTAAGAFGGPELAGIRHGLYGKTGTAPVSEDDATVWFMGWLEPGSLPGQQRRLAFAAFVSHSQLTGGAHAAPIVAALFKAMAAQSGEQKGKLPSIAVNGWAAAMTR